jgi:hypothetical protein
MPHVSMLDSSLQRSPQQQYLPKAGRQGTSLPFVSGALAPVSSSQARSVFAADDAQVSPEGGGYGGNDDRVK